MPVVGPSAPFMKIIVFSKKAISLMRTHARATSLITKRTVSWSEINNTDIMNNFYCTAPLKEKLATPM